MGILMSILFTIPLVFQFIAPRIFSRVNFWIITLISVALVFVVTWLNLYLMGNSLTKNDIRCGMPLVGTIVIGFFTGFVLIAIVLIQALLRRKSRMSKIEY